MFVKRLREWDGFCAAPTTEKTVETVRAFALAVWRTVKGTRAKSKEVVRVKRSSTLKQTPLDVAKFQKQPVEVQEKDGEKDGLIVLSEEEDSSSSLNDAEFERGALAAAKDVGLSFPHPINQRTRAGIKEGQKQGRKQGRKPRRSLTKSCRLRARIPLLNRLSPPRRPREALNALGGVRQFSAPPPPCGNDRFFEYRSLRMLRLKKNRIKACSPNFA